MIRKGSKKNRGDQEEDEVESIKGAVFRTMKQLYKKKYLRECCTKLVSSFESKG
jgi:hypothetical protein